MTKREPLMSEEYFDQDLAVVEAFIQKTLANMATYANPVAAKFDLFRDSLTLLYARYSRGFPVSAMQSDFLRVLEAWEAVRKADVADIYSNSFKDDLTDYVESLGLLALAKLLHCDASVIVRLLACIGNVGKDLLFERLVVQVVGPQGRKPAAKLLYPKSYQALYDALDAPAAEKPPLVQQFLQHWYKRIKNVGWYDAHKGPEGGGFKGYWCWEAAGVAYAFGIDDGSFRDLPYYPQDLAAYARTEKQAL